MGPCRLILMVGGGWYQREEGVRVWRVVDIQSKTDGEQRDRTQRVVHHMYITPTPQCSINRVTAMHSHTSDGLPSPDPGGMARLACKCLASCLFWPAKREAIEASSNVNEQGCSLLMVSREKVSNKIRRNWQSNKLALVLVVSCRGSVRVASCSLQTEKTAKVYTKKQC